MIGLVHLFSIPDDPKKGLFGSSSISFFYEVNLLETLHEEWNTVSLTVGADPTIGLQCEMATDSLPIAATLGYGASVTPGRDPVLT
nr:hypothetical protein [Tanacetum cinerariifolium]